MKKLVECVPNFSEGRDKQKIQDIIDHILMIEGITILDVDSGEDTNRTVVTIVGEPKPIKEIEEGNAVSETTATDSTDDNLQIESIWSSNINGGLFVSMLL